MARFLVTVSERHAVTYLVEGDSANQVEEAYERDTAGWERAVQVFDDMVGVDVVTTAEESNWSPLERARVNEALSIKEAGDR